MTITYPIRVEPGRYKIKNKASGVFLSLEGDAGSLLGVRSTSTHTDQQWEVSYLGNGEFRIMSYARGLFVAAPKGDHAQDVFATGQIPLPSETRGRWTFQAIGNSNSGDLFIRSIHNNKTILELGEARMVEAARICVVAPNNPVIDEQVWNLLPF